VTPVGDLLVAVFAVLLFPYAVGAGVRGWRSYAYVPAVFVAIAVTNLEADTQTASDWIFPTALALAAYAAGRNALHRTALAVELHEAALRADEEREAQARLAVAAERRRIAHEMHDVVGHSISVMVVQAGGARRILERDPERAEQAAAQIERTGRETLLEMRRLLGVMRDPRTAATREPNPTLDGLDGLVARARGDGLPVQLRVQGERRRLSQGLELAAYRVVEDALEEVMRVAPGLETDVLVVWGADALEITVADGRPYVPFADGAGPSLIGVRERVALYGGELRMGQRPDGGHEVHVRFPLTPQTDAVPAQGAA
jgi:signal transduction histidine kinase